MIIKECFNFRETADFISVFQNDLKTWTAWLQNSSSEIEEQLKKYSINNMRFFKEVRQNEKLIGFAGFYGQPESKTIRMLGPYVCKEYKFEEISDMLFNALKKEISPDYEKIRIAFTSDNTDMLNFCKIHKFNKYNEEKNLSFPKHRKNELILKKNFNIIEYTDEFAGQFKALHFTNAYFTANEILSFLDSTHKLYLAVDQNELLGYSYIELIPDEEIVEICFLNVSDNKRGTGIGSEILKYVILKAFERDDISSAEIYVRTGNDVAEKLYLKTGFIEKKIVNAFELLI